MYMIIYKTTNLINGKIYVGKDSINDPQYFGSGLILNRAIKKHGIHNFRKDILEQCKNSQELDEREQYWIKELNTIDRSVGYNIAKGGTGGDTFTNQSDEKKASILSKRMSKKPLWDTPEYRKRLGEHAKKMWKNPLHRDHMVKVMRGREIKWSDKISKSIKKWHKTNPIPETSKQHAAELKRQKMTGREFKPISNDVKQRIIFLYQAYGPKLISIKLSEEGIEISRYLIIRLLKKEGVYQKWQKGIGEKSKRYASVSRCGTGNPMFGRNKLSS